MHQLVQRSFGGLSKGDYLRHLFFGAALAALALMPILRQPRPVPVGLLAVVAVNTLLYPYARFAYESAVGFLMGDNVFTVPAFVGLFTKALTMALCFALAVFIAPLGLVYLYARGRSAPR